MSNRSPYDGNSRRHVTRRVMASRRDVLRLFATGLGVSLTTGALAACGGAAEPGSTEPAGGSSGTSAAGGAAASPTAGTSGAQASGPSADLISAAKDEGTVLLYTSLDTQIVDAIIKPFKEKYGVDVQYYRGGSADVSSKVLSEADAGKVQADIVDASDVGAFIAMKEKGLLVPYDSPSTKSVPENLRDPDNMWVADRLTQSVIQYNSELVTTTPEHWQDLTDPQYQGQLVYFSASNGDGAPRLYTLAKAFGWDLLEGLAANEPLRVQTPQVVTQTLENGERAIGFAQNDNIAWRSKQQEKPTDYFYPDEGIPVELGAVGLIKDAEHPNAAKLFYDWWMGDEGQRLLVAGGKYSSRTDLDPPTGAPPLSELKLLVLDYAEYQSQRSEILGRMAEIFGGEWGQ